MRLFISCEIPQEISGYIHALAKQLPEAKVSVPKNIDLTIKFLGDVPDTKLEEIKQKLSELRFKPFKAMLNGIGVFTEDFIRVVWVGLTPSEKFEELHVLADNVLEKLFQKEKRFQAHLTIARVKYVEDKKKFLDELKKIKVEPLTFEVNKIILFKSQLSPKGATHEPLMEIVAQ
ncbi:MAG: RNA 2',3'-cyclic phosphodiesterase [Candidatus Woesearchaeota archaeon]